MLISIADKFSVVLFWVVSVVLFWAATLMKIKVAVY